MLRPKSFTYSPHVKLLKGKKLCTFSIDKLMTYVHNEFSIIKFNYSLTIVTNVSAKEMFAQPPG